MTMSMQDKETGGTVSFAFLYCGPEAFKMYGFEVVEDFHAPNGEGYWLSESAFRKFGTDPAEPKMPEILGEWYQGTVAGVVKDFALTDAAHVNDDLLGILSVYDDPDSPYRVLRIEGDHKEAEKELQALYKRFSMERDGYEGIPELSGFMKDQLDAQLGEAENYMRLIELFMFLARCWACWPCRLFTRPSARTTSPSAKSSAVPSEGKPLNRSDRTWFSSASPA